MTNALLLRLFTSEFFNSWIAVSYLFRYSDNIGIQHYLCAELKKFPISEIEFFLPQLIHLLITRPSDSVALESFLVEMCEKSTHMALMTLWYLQAYLSDLSLNPNTSSFGLCKRLLNKCQAIVFSNGDNDDQKLGMITAATAAVRRKNEKVKENAIPALVGMGALLLGIGQPLMTKPAGRIAIAQGRRNRTFSITSQQQEQQQQQQQQQKDHNQTTADELLSATTVITRRNTVDVTRTTRAQYDDRKSTVSDIINSNNNMIKHHSSQPNLVTLNQNAMKKKQRPVSYYNSSPTLEDLHGGKAFSMSRYIKNAQQKINQKITKYQNQQQQQQQQEENDNDNLTNENKFLSSSLSKHLSIYDPNLTALGQSSVPTNTAILLSPAFSTIKHDCHCSLSSSTQEDLHRKRHTCKHSKLSFESTTPTSLTSSSSLSSYSSEEDDDDDDDDTFITQNRKNELKKKMMLDPSKLLRSNYFRSEMQFLLALVDIATRLVIVPKEARMSALHAELTLLNHNLPAEICLPLWCPATSERPYHHRIVRISPSDAVVLNSAERAPYLLMIEVLDDEMSIEDAGYHALMMKRRKHKCTLVKKNKAKRKPIIQEKQEQDNNTLDDVMDMGDYCKNTRKQQQQQQQQQLEEQEKKKEMERNKSNGFVVDDYAERMRTAAVMLAQLQQSVVSSSHTSSLNSTKSKQGTEQIRQRIIKEMVALEEQRMMKMKTDGLGLISHDDMLQEEQRINMVVNKEDPSAAVLSEDWETKKARLRAASPYGHLPNWRLISVIVKNGADLRQEQFAVQLIREMQLIWADTGVDVWVKYFRILVTSDSSGLMETLKNTISIHSIKKDAYARGWNQKDTLFTLYDYFEKIWGPPDSEEFIKAQDAFMRSLAGYSIACYVLQIKDRHNGNLLIDEAGHLIHIDFGFMLSNSPGSVGFEMAPFKLPQDYIDILGGIHGEKFAEYKALMKAAFLSVRKHSENILLLTEMMSINSKLACFQNGEMTVSQLRDRFQLHLTEPQAEEFVDKLIMSSCCNVFTRLYDTFQYYSQGIL